MPVMLTLTKITNLFRNGQDINMKTYYCLVCAVLQGCLVISQGESTLNVSHATTEGKATFDCTSPNADITAPFSVHQNNLPIYECADISFTCSKISADTDYTDILFTNLGSPTAKGTFTVTNPSKTRDGGVWKCQFGSSSPSGGINFPVTTPTPAVLSVYNVVEGETATFDCSYSSITSTSSLEIRKDNELIYICANIAFTCSALSAEADYSDVIFTGIGTPSGKGTFTVDNANQAWDGGSWLCKYGSSLASDPVVFVVNATYTSPTGVNETFTNTTQLHVIPILGLSDKQRFGLIAGCVGVVVVICCSICICAIMRRKVNKKKRRRRQERRKALEANVQNSESL